MPINHPKIAVIGSSSMIGSRFVELTKTRLQVIEADLHGNISVDITDKSSVNNFFKNHNFEWIILFSAFTDVDEAENQRGDKNGTCWKINVDGCRNIVQKVAKYNKKLIFISTDFVFDGNNGPYSEEDEVGPELEKVGWYGITKIESEKIVKTLNQYLLIRISYPYRSNFDKKLDFARNILKKEEEGDLYPMFSDQIITPTFIDDIAEAILLLVSKNENGIFHLGSPQTVTPYDFAQKLLNVFKRDTNQLKKGSLEDLLKIGKTPRPLKGGMKSDKIINKGFTPTNWNAGIEKMHKQISKKID